MAAADYRLCDKCSSKAFYDANLNYEWNAIPAVRETTYGLDNLGDWAVLCCECAKTHRCAILPINEEPTP